jgi:hypothetical protein
MRPMDRCFLVLCACFGAAACASGSEFEGFNAGIGSGISPDEMIDSGNTYYPGADSGSAYDSGSIQSEASTPDVLEPIDTARPIDSAPPTTCTLTLPTGDPTCDSCIETSCCAADNACGTDPDCMNFGMCASDCEGIDPDSGLPDDAGADSGACIATCESTYPTGATELNAIDTCLETTCASACDAL